EPLQRAIVHQTRQLNLPSRQPLNQSWRRGSASAAADVVLAIEMNDLWGSSNAYSHRIVRTSRPMTKSGAKVVTLGTRDLYLKSNYQDFGRFADVDLAIAGDGEASLPLLVERVKTRLRSAKRTTLEARGKSL